MSRPEGAAGTSGRRRDKRNGGPLRVPAERLPQHGAVYDDTARPAAGSLTVAPGDAVIPRARPATGRIPPTPSRAHTPARTRTAPVSPVPPPGVPAPPLAALTGDGRAGGGGGSLPVLAPRPLRGRLRMLLRMWIPSHRRGRHRTGAPHLRDAWSMFAPQGRPRRRVRLR